MAEKRKQTWVVRYLRIDSETRRLPLSFTCTVEADHDGEAKMLAMGQFNNFVREHRLTVQFFDSDKV